MQLLKNNSIRIKNPHILKGIFLMHKSKTNILKFVIKIIKNAKLIDFRGFSFAYNEETKELINIGVHIYHNKHINQYLIVAYFDIDGAVINCVT